MKFNYGREKRKFEAMWEKLRKEYKEAGMSEANIQKMYEYDWEMFKKERVFCIHNQFMPDGVFDDDTYKDEGQNPLFMKFGEQMSVNDQYFCEGKFDWIEQMDNVQLINCLHKLTEDQILLLTDYYVERKSISEMANDRGLSYVAVKNRLDRLREKMRKIIEKMDS